MTLETFLNTLFVDPKMLILYNFYVTKFESSKKKLDDRASGTFP